MSIKAIRHADGAAVRRPGAGRVRWTRSARTASTSSPRAPATASGSMSMSSGRGARAHSAVRSRTAISRCRWSPLAMGLGVIPPDAATGLNYGLDKVRFIAPVRAGARVRTRVTLLSAKPQGGGRMLLKLHCTLDIEAETKPALVAEMLCMLIGKRSADIGSRAQPRFSGERACTTDEIREQAAQHTLAANPLVGIRGRDILDSAQLLFAQMLRNPSRRSAICFPRRAGTHRRRPLRSRAGREGPALRRPGLDGERRLPRAGAVLYRLGRSAQALPRRRDRRAMPSAPASSYRCSSMRWRRPTRSSATRRR